MEDMVIILFTMNGGATREFFCVERNAKTNFLIIACKCGGSTKHKLGVNPETPPFVQTDN
jgi:hypothetical protein